MRSVKCIIIDFCMIVVVKDTKCALYNGFGCMLVIRKDFEYEMNVGVENQ